MTKKTILIYINGLGCNTIYQRSVFSDHTILAKIEEVLTHFKIQNKQFKIGDKLYTLKEVKDLENHIHTLKTHNIVYDLLYLLKNKYIINILNDLYLLYILELYNIQEGIETVHVLCDPSTHNQLKNISTYFCNFNRYSNMKSMNREDNYYYEDSLNYVLKYLKDPQYNNVIVIGHSYGGSITSKIAKYLNTYKLPKKQLDKLQMATVGSIYIANPFKTSRIKIHHYVYQNDPAYTNCSRINNPYMYKNLHVMKSTRVSFKENEHFSKIFKKENIEAHANYDIIVKNILKHNDTDIDINNLE